MRTFGLRRYFARIALLMVSPLGPPLLAGCGQPTSDGPTMVSPDGASMISNPSFAGATVTPTSPAATEPSSIAGDTQAQNSPADAGLDTGSVAEPTPPANPAQSPSSEPPPEPVAQGPDVRVEETEDTFVLSNGLVRAVVSKVSGNMRSLTYKGTETLSGGGYWSHDTRGGVRTDTRITIDPQNQDGDRAEVSVKAISGGNTLGFGPGAEDGGDLAIDIEIRYSLGRGETGVYTYSVFEHRPEYPAGMMAEARFVAGLTSTFDWITVDEQRNRYYPAPLENEDKYVFTAVQFANRAYGFSSTEDHIGFWLVNPTTEYLSGGPTKPEFLCHRNTNQTAAPVVLNYWRSSHYGGASVTLDAGEHWVKVVGPFLLYVNEGQDPAAMWEDAKLRAHWEQRKWPYDWVAGVDYPGSDQRARVTGQLLVDDPWDESGGRLNGRLFVGLAHPAYVAPSALGGEREISWQLNAKHYQFWVEVDDPLGAFAIPNVRPGTYTLHAFADGILGEYSQANIEVSEPGELNLGRLNWTPVRRGRPLWEVGIANRSGVEFLHGERFFEPDVQLHYPKLFPEDVNFVVGESDYRKDWYFQHIPHDDQGTGTIVPYRGVQGTGRATPFRIHFNLDSAPAGQATLRLAISGTETKVLKVQVNDRPAGEVALGIADGVITRHQVHGLWYERELSFPANLLRAGANTLTLTVPAGPLNSGVIYDYLRLELDD